MILVTGGTGFLGSHLLAKLAGSENLPIRTIIRNGSSTKKTEEVFEYYGNPDSFKNIEWVKGDLLDYGSMLEATQNVTHVFHCGAEVSFQKKNKKGLISNNVNGTKNLINACLVNNVSRFCHVSSIAALGSTENNEPIDETTQWKVHKQNSPYSISKYYSELHVWRGFSEGLTGIVINPSVIIGPKMTHSGLDSIFELVKKGLNYYPEGCTGFVNVQDVTKVMIRLCLHSEISNEKYIVSGENTTYKDLIMYIADSLGKTPPEKQISASGLSRLATLSSLLSFFTKKPAISKDLVKMATSKYHYSNKKICETLNYNFTSVKDTISEIALEYSK